MNKKNLFIFIVVVMIMAFGFSTVSAASKTDQWGWDTWFDYNRATSSCGFGSCCGNNWGFNCNPYYSCIRNYSRPYQAEFVSDVTYPDGSFVTPGKRFTKTWRIRNVGTAAWTSGTALVFSSGDQMGAPARVEIPYCVPSGQTVDISVNMIAPSAAISAKGEWMLVSPYGERFGVGCNGQVPVWVSIATWGGCGGPSCACTGRPNCACAPCTGTQCWANGGPRAGRNPYCNNKIRSIKDITVQDGSVMAPNTVFRKTWQMKNGGTCVWDNNYTLVFAGGDNLGGVESSHLSKKVYPGNITQVSIDLVAPSTPGVYRAYYKLRDNMGYEFGFGSYADEAFWVEIVVEEPELAEAPASAPAPVTEVAMTAAPAPAPEFYDEPEAVPAPEFYDESVAASAPEGVEEPETVPEEDDALLNFEEEAAMPNPEEEDAALMDTGEEMITKSVEVAENLCENQKISLKRSEDGYVVTWSGDNSGSNDWDSATYKMVMSDCSQWLENDQPEIALPDTASGERAEIEFPIRLAENANPEDGELLWMEFYLTDGTDKFCKFYFDIPQA